MKVPFEGNDQTTSGSILNATTTMISGLRFFNFSIKSGSLRLVGCSIFKLFFSAIFFTADEVIFFPLPDGLSGEVTTATKSNFFSNILDRHMLANSGVPKKLFVHSF